MALFKLSGVVMDGTTGTSVPTRQDISFPQGEDATFQITITGQNGTPINLTGYTGSMVWKYAQNSVMTSPLTLSMALSNPTQGIGTFTLSATVSKGLTQSLWWYDVFISGGGSKDEVIPVSLLTLNLAIGM